METPRIDRFFRVLVEEIRRSSPQFLESPFTVAEIYQSLIPYRTHRDLLGVDINGDYEDALMRLIAGEGEYLILESEPARLRIRRELDHANPNTGLYRDFAAVDVRLNMEKVPEADVEHLDGWGAALPLAPTSRDAEAGITGEQAVLGGPAQASPEQCPACDVRLPERESVRFCPECGADVRMVACSRCGELLERGWKYCVACGTPIAT